jgi:1-acyl-sn-glycerol-3-phosphate acyltransferase
LSLWGFAKPVLLAVALAPVLMIVVGLAHRFITQGQTLKETAIVLVGSPIAFAFLLIISAIPALVVTSILAGALIALQRALPYASVLLWILVPVCLIYTWVALGRYPSGDGGTGQSLTEMIKATCAASIAIWCVLAARG